MDTEILGVISTGIVVKGITALLAAFSMWLLARVLDRLSGIYNFHDKLEKLEGTAFSLYYGLRLVAIALLMGFIFSG